VNLRPRRPEPPRVDITPLIDVVFLMLIFFIVHVYLATAGHTWTSHIKAMITGWEEVE
jgi:biopolymer transport protein ExbD